MKAKQRISRGILMCSIFSSLLVTNVFADVEKKVKSKVEKAIVFLQGAQLFSSGDFFIPAGTSNLIFEGVSPFIDAQTLQATGTGDIVILDVMHTLKYPELKSAILHLPSKNTKSIKLVEDSILELAWKLEELADKKTAFTIEKNTLLNNRLIKGESKRDSLALLKDALDYLRNRLNNINTEMLRLKKEEQILVNKKSKLEERLSILIEEEANAGKENPLQKEGAVNQVIVTVSSLFATNTTVKINYFVMNAGWTPSYDLRALSESKNIKLDQRASVYQNSGVDWTDVSLMLSTGTPGQGNTKPTLGAKLLSYYLPRTYKYSESAAPAMLEKSLSYTNSGSLLDDNKSAKTASDYTVIVENPIRVEYVIKLKYSIPSDNKQHQVLIQSKELETEFVYSSIPKLDANAFFIAKVTDWEALNLLPGSARIYFDGSFIGNTSINPSLANDTLLLNMGRDNNLVFEYKKIKDRSNEKIFNNDKTLSFTYEITIRNTKSTAIKLEIEDQIPISQNEEIKIELQESNKAELNSDSGLLKWTINLKPKEVRKIVFSYSVTYPKNKQLAGL